MSKRKKPQLINDKAKISKIDKTVASALTSSEAPKVTDVEEIISAIIPSLKGSELSEQYKASYILTALGNALLLSKSVVDRSNPLNDPLEYKQNILTQQLAEKEVFLHYLQNPSVNIKPAHSDFPGNNPQAYQETINQINSELNSVKSLLEEKKLLYKTFGGLFPYIPKKLTDTFVKNYNDTFKVNKNAQEILQELKNNRDNMPDSKVMKYGKLFALTMSKKTIITKTIITKITDIIGKKLTAQELEKNQNKIANEDIKGLKKQNDIAVKLEELCSLANIQKLHNHLAKAYPYTLDNDYLKSIKQEEFLVQVRIYKKLGRDMMKSVILLHSGGYETTKITIPPGINTTLEILPSGATKYLLGELGSYSKIAEWNTSTLENYSNMFQTGVPRKKKKISSNLYIKLNQ
jgi:hypothetical protein